MVSTQSLMHQSVVHRISIDASDLARFAQLATTLTGLEFPESRLPDLARAVRETVAQAALSSSDGLYDQLARSKPDPTIMRTFISHLTIGETHFFRNQPQFEALSTTILPEIIERRKETRHLRIWSAACATGEEPYSVAILLDRLLPDYASWDVSILATDIDQHALERARLGIYGEWSFRQVAPETRARYFTQQGRFYELAPRIRQRVTFAPLNLAENAYPSLLNNTAHMDLILCRNVLIYFSPATTRAVAERLYRALSDEGWLLVGHVEPSQETFARYATVNLPGVIAYRRQQVPEHITLCQTAKGAQKYAKSVEYSACVEGKSAKIAAMWPPQPEPALALPQPVVRGNAIPAKAAPTTPIHELLTRAAAQPNDGSAAYAVACCYAEQRHWREAEQWIGRAIERSPLLASAHYLHALLLLEAGHSEPALAAARRCTYADPNYVAGHLLLALLYRRSGDKRRADAAQATARSLLQRHAPDAVIPDTDGASAGQLLAAMAHQ